MTVHVTIHPNIGDDFDDQTNISLNLFNNILETANSHIALHNSREVISRDIKIHE
jgi:hypothetical protein